MLAQHPPLALLKQWIEYRIAALVLRCLLYLTPTYLVEFSPILSALDSRSLCLAKQGLLYVSFALVSIRDNIVFSVVSPSVCIGIPFLLRSLPGTLAELSQAFIARLKMVLSGRDVVGSFPEILNIILMKRCYRNSCNEWIYDSYN